MIVDWKCFTPVLLLCDLLLVSGIKVAVFEHAQQRYALPNVPKDIIRTNLKYYQRAADFAASKGVQIIVFPEYGIVPSLVSRKELKNYLEHIPDPKVNHSIPCDDPVLYKDRPILYTLSCLARKNEMVIVANMVDTQPCERRKNCPEDGNFHFNTNVAFGKDGKLLVRYYKEYLFGENAMDVPKNVQDPVFETHLGRFATFICFDIVFQKITEVARTRGVKAILFSTMWINSSPLFTSFQFFDSWARGNNVTLLAANVQLPGKSGLGSGIFKGREGAQVYTFNPDGNSKLLMTNLEWNECASEPKSSIYKIYKNRTEEWNEDGKDLKTVCSKTIVGLGKDVYKDYWCLERNMTNFTLTKLVKSRGHLTSCHNGMCCSLEYSADEFREDFYFGVYNGSYNTIKKYSFAEENCFLARCDSLGRRPCATFPMRSKTLFYQISLQANFSTDFIYPSVMESDMRLMPSKQWHYNSMKKAASIYFRSSLGKYVLVVGLKARAYDRDPPYVR